MVRIKVLSVRQPYAWLIVDGHKDIENRTWRTSHRGQLFIHASQTIDREAVRQYKKLAREQGVEWPDKLPVGCIIGRVGLIDCVKFHPSPWFAGPVGWVLKNPTPLPVPLPRKGKLGVWETTIEKNELK